MKAKRELIRVVRTPEGEIVVDGTGKKSGRGAYICPSRECFQQAVKRKALSRSLDRAIPPEAVEELEEKVAEHERA